MWICDDTGVNAVADGILRNVLANPDDILLPGVLADLIEENSNSEGHWQWTIPKLRAGGCWCIYKTHLKTRLLTWIAADGVYHYLQDLWGWGGRFRCSQANCIGRSYGSSQFYVLTRFDMRWVCQHCLPHCQSEKRWREMKRSMAAGTVKAILDAGATCES